MHKRVSQLIPRKYIVSVLTEDLLNLILLLLLSFVLVSSL